MSKQVSTITEISHDKKHILPLPYLSDIDNVGVVQLA
jgi:hypothetical protein